MTASTAEPGGPGEPSRAPAGPARRPRRWVVVASAVVATLALALVGTGVVLAGTALAADLPPPATARGAGTLPDDVRSLPGSAATSTDAPAGRASVLAQVVSNSLDEDDLAVIGADADSYRRVPLLGSSLDLDEEVYLADIAHVVLSPDGTRVALPGVEDGAVVMVVRDLRSGASRVYDEAALSVPYAVAWSPDGRALAVLDGGPDGDQQGRVQVLDLEDGTSTVVVEGVGSRGGVSFSGDGRRVLVQDAALLLVVERDGTVVRRVPFVGDGVLAQRHAWSPDGALAVMEGCEEDCETMFGPGSRSVSFVALAGGDVPDPIELRGGRLASVVGWRSPREVVLGVTEDDGERTVVAAYDVGSGTRTVLTTLDLWDVVGVDLAADVLARGTVRQAGELDGGPRPAWPGLLVTVAGLVVGLVGGGVVTLVAVLTRRRVAAGSGLPQVWPPSPLAGPAGWPAPTWPPLTGLPGTGLPGAGPPPGWAYPGSPLVTGPPTGWPPTGWPPTGWPPPGWPPPGWAPPGWPLPGWPPPPTGPWTGSPPSAGPRTEQPTAPSAAPPATPPEPPTTSPRPTDPPHPSTTSPRPTGPPEV